MITRTQRLSWSTNLFIQQHSCKHDLHNNQGKPAWSIILFG
jgi:hypothetical protein